MLKRLIITFFIFFWCPFYCHAQQHLEDSLRGVIAQGKNDAEAARAYNALAYEYSRKDAEKSHEYLQSAIAIGRKINNPRKLSGSYAQLVYLFHDIGRHDSAEYYLSLVKDLTIQPEGPDKNVIASVYYSCAAMYYKKSGNYKKAIPFFESAIALNEKTGDKESTAGQTLNLGNTYADVGDYKKATEQHLKALQLFEQIGSERGVSFCYQSLSNSFTKLKQYNKALLYADKSLKIKTILKDRQGLVSAQSGLGDIYLGTGNLEKALFHFTNSLDIAKELKNMDDEQGNYFSIAKVYAAKNDAVTATDYYNRSRQLARQLKDSSSLAAIDAELIALKAGVQKTIESESQLVSTLELFRERGDLNRQAAGFKNMVDFYTASGKFEKALEYNNKYHQTIDSIHNNELQLQVKKMEELYNVEKKEGEIDLLKKDQLLNQARLQKQKIVQGAFGLLVALLILIALLSFNRYKLRNKMKELELRNQIAADLHDEVGSSLSSIHMLSQMATQNGNEAKQKDILARMSSNAKETMDKMGDIVWMIKPGETEAGSLKQRMERFAYEICSSKNIEVSMQLADLDKAKLAMEQRKNIYLIFKEALNNAVKYSGTEKIDIRLSLQQQQLILMVQDFGKGFDSSLIKKGNGLDNLQTRAKELGGRVDIVAVPGEGTTIKLIAAVGLG